MLLNFTTYGKNSPLIRLMQHVDNFKIDFFICNSIDSSYVYLSILVNQLIIIIAI